MKRLVFALVLALALVLPAGPIGAATEARAVSFTLTGAVCPNLPPEAVLTGEGTLVERTVVHEHDGITTVSTLERAVGTATDQDGDTYRFVYLNKFRISNSLEDPFVLTGVMLDSFKLVGGPLALANGFIAEMTVGPAEGQLALEEIASFGDPFDFENLRQVCDPL